MIAVLIGCGLRRAEAAALKLEDVQLRDGRWVIADLNGKGGHIRTVPVLGEESNRRMDSSRWTHFRPTVPSHQQGGPDVGKWIHTKSDLVDR